MIDESASLGSFLSLSGTSSAAEAVMSMEPRLAVPPLKALEAATAGADAVGPTDLRTANEELRRVIDLLRWCNT